MEGPRYDVFLSHTSSDKPVVEELAHLLRERGIEPWLDVWHLVPGAPWQEAIEKALRSCTTVAVCLGPSGTGPWQNEEMRAAINRRVTDKAGNYRVIPVLLPGTERGERSRYPDFLTSTTWVEFRDTLDDKQALHRLVCGIRGVEPDPELESLVVVEGVSPYRGLQSFDVEDARFFFGREAQTEWLLDKLRPASAGNRFLAILGPSGSGKSSLARAGLLALLKKGEKIPGSQDWPVAISKPGAQPLESLAVALTSAVRPGDSSLLGLIRDLEKDSRTLHLTTRLALHDAPAERRFVVLVDQFEEIFTLCSDEAQRKALIDNLLHAATASEGRTVVLLTLRADFYGRCAAYPALAAAVSDRQILVGPMSPEELRRAIERPALLAGCELEAGLADLLMEEVEDQPGSLPLLQHALLQLWNRRKGRRLTVEAYRDIGGVRGALERHAEEIYSGFGGMERDMCRRVFLGLVQPAEGDVFTRRRVLLADLLPAAGGATFGRELQSVVGKLADARLLTTGDQKNPSVELAHEALIQGWSRFRGWSEHDREALLVRRHLDETAAEWAANDRDPSYLYRGSLLARAEEWVEENPGELNRSEREFLDASLALRDEERRRELSQVQALEAEQRRRAEAEHQRAEEQARASQRFKRLSFRLAGVLILALIAAGMAFYQTWKSERQRRTILAKDLAGRAETVFGAQPAAGLLLAVEAVKLSRRGSDPHITEPEESLRWALASSGGRPLRSGRVTAVAATPDRRWVVTAGVDQTVRIWDLGSKDPATSGRILAHLDEGVVSALALSADRRWLLTRVVDGAEARVYLRDLTSTEGQDVLPEEDWFDESDPFSPDGRWMVTHDAGVPILRDMKKSRALSRLRLSDLQASAYSPDSRWLATAATNRPIELWDLHTMGSIASIELPKDKSEIKSLIFSPNGQWLAATESGGSALLWRLKPEITPVDLPYPRTESKPRNISEIAFGAKSKSFYAWGENSTEGRFWSLPSSPSRVVLKTDASFSFPLNYNKTTFIGLSMGGELDIRKSAEGVIHLGWPLEPTYLPGQAEPIKLAVSSPDKKWLLLQGDMEPPRLWKIRNGQLNAVEPKTSLYPFQTVLAMAGNGNRVVATAAEETATTVSLWDLSGNIGPRDIPDAKDTLIWTFDSEGSLMAAANRLSLLKTVFGIPEEEQLLDTITSVRLWQLPSKGVIPLPRLLPGCCTRSPGPVQLPAFGMGNPLTLSSKGHWLAVGSAGDAFLWSLRATRAGPQKPTRHPEGVSALAFGTGDRSLVTAGNDGKIRRYDLRRATTPVETRNSNPVTAIAFSSDGTWLAAADRNRKVILWKPEENDITLNNPGDVVFKLVFSSDGHRLASMDRLGQVQIWKIDEETARGPVRLRGHDKKVQALAFSPDGRKLITASEGGAVHHWDLRLGEILKLACQTVGRNLTEEEWEDYILGEPYQENEPCPELATGK